MNDDMTKTLESRVNDLMEALTIKEGVDDKLIALGESVIIKETFDVPISTIMLAGLDVNSVNKSKNNEVGAALEAIRKMSFNNKISVVSVGYAANNLLGGMVQSGDEVILDMTSSSYGVMYLIFKDNARCPMRVGHLLGSDYVTKTLIEEMLKVDNNTMFKNGTMELHSYVKVSYLHLACKK